MQVTGNNPSRRDNIDNGRSDGRPLLDTAKTVLVPAELYEQGAEAEFLRFNGMELASGEIAVVARMHDGSGGAGDIVAVMGIASSVWAKVAREFGAGGAGDTEGAGADSIEGGEGVENIDGIEGVAGIEVRSQLLELVRVASGEAGSPSVGSGIFGGSKGSGSRGKRSVNIFLTHQNTYLVVWEKGLKMAEVFPDNSIDSLLYYMQVIGRRFKLRRFEIFVGGDKAGVVADTLRRYFGNVSLAL